MRNKYKEYMELLALLRDENQSMRDKSNNTPVMDGYFEGKIMAFDRSITVFSRTFHDELTEESN